MAAQTSSTYTDSTKNLRFITNTDLSKFNTCFENCCEILYKLTEINSAVCRKIKQYFIVIKCIFRIYQLHLQTMLTNLLLTDFKRFSLSDSVLCLSLIILLCRYAEYFFERMNNIFLTYFSRCKYNFPVLYSTGSLHDHMIASFNLVILRAEIINLAYITKSYAYYFCHSISP